MALTQVDQGLLGTYAQYTGFKNRIINGAMVISQRNGTSTVATPTDGQYVLDRFATFTSGGGVYSVGQSTTAPAGFNNSMLFTVTTVDSSIAATDYYLLVQQIEGYNIADLGFGTANAQTVTVSFWVRSSVTGTFGFGLRQGSGTRSYVATYTISSANTWEQKTITIAGDTSGTWDTTNGPGMIATWDLGSGSNRNGTANTWNAGNLWRTSACTNLIANSGATLYITGVQLEKGSTATSFDYRPYGTELVLCQRYCHVWTSGGSSYCQLAVGYTQTNSANTVYKYPQIMRTTPTATFSEQNKWLIDMPATSVTTTSISIGYGTPEQTRILPVVASGVTSGNPCAVANNGDAGTRTIIFSAEL